jgi:hypothetical protein
VGVIIEWNVLVVGMIVEWNVLVVGMTIQWNVLWNEIFNVWWNTLGCARRMWKEARSQL